MYCRQSECSNDETLFQYYFGDMNLPRDKFLKTEIKKEDGCILRPMFSRNPLLYGGGSLGAVVLKAM